MEKRLDTILNSSYHSEGLTVLNPTYHCGSGGIRTPDTVASVPTFQIGAFDHSATLPNMYLSIALI